MDLVKGAAGVAITMVVGGTVYTVNQADVVDNFAEDTGLTQQQAEEYVESVDESELVSYDELGQSYIDEGNATLEIVDEIDCVNYTYDWESSTMSCSDAVNQLIKTGNDEIAVGRSYIRLDADSAGRADIMNTINLLETVNQDYSFEIISRIWDNATLDDAQNTNSYNKALLEAALESE